MLIVAAIDASLPCRHDASAMRCRDDAAMPLAAAMLDYVITVFIDSAVDNVGSPPPTPLMMLPVSPRYATPYRCAELRWLHADAACRCCCC